MLSSAQLKQITTEARPIIERQLEDAERLAGLRDVVAAAGGDWGQLKALIKAQIRDEQDEAGEGKHVRKILDKADYAKGYADMLGIGSPNMNENNSFGDSDPAFDRWLEEVADRVDPGLLLQIIEGSKTAAGRAIIMAAIKVVKEDRRDDVPHDADGVVIEDDNLIPAFLSPAQPNGAEPRTPAGAAAVGETAQNSELAGASMASARQPSIGEDAVPSDANAGGENELRRVTTDPQPGHNAGEHQRPQESTSDHAPAESAADEISAPNSEPVTAVPPPAITATGDDSAATPSAAVVVPELASVDADAGVDRSGSPRAPLNASAPVANDYTKPNPWCQDPEDCGVNASWNHMCGGCIRLKAERQAAGAVQ